MRIASGTPPCFARWRNKDGEPKSRFCASFGLGLASEIRSEGFTMRFPKLMIVACVVGFFSLSMAAQEIRGDYLETRSADVYTGQCFANGEVNLVGNEAILAWHVRGGSWEGVQLQGLTVAAAVRANGTLGDPYENPFPAKAVLLVDDLASAQQRMALVSFAKHMGGELLRNVEQV